MDVREATATDVDAIRDVAEAAWNADYPAVLTRETVADGVEEWYDEQRISEALTVPGATLYVLEDDGAIVGFSHAFRSQDTGDILRLYIHPDDRRRGLGTTLLESTIEELFSQGVDRIRAMVLAANEIGQSFYESFGFERGDAGETTIAGQRYPEYTYVLASRP